MLKGRKSSRALLSWEEEEYPTEAGLYELLEEIGRGATARVRHKPSSPEGVVPSALVCCLTFLLSLQVWTAKCKPKGCKVAIKLVDLEKHQGNTALVGRGQSPAAQCFTHELHLRL